jgi:hypothetical protein
MSISNGPPDRPARRVWQEPRLTFVGHLTEIVQGNKHSPQPGDPGENRVPKAPCPPKCEP